MSVGKKEEVVFHIQKKDPKEDAKQYNIKTMQNIFDCIEDTNIDKFLLEFEMVLRSALIMKELGKSMDSKVDFPGFVWIDD